MKFMNLFLPILIFGSAASILSSCASVPMAGLDQDQEAKQFKAPPDKARIYIYRNESFGFAIKVTINLDGKFVGQSAAKTYYAIDVEPGTHLVSCFAESNSQISVNAKQGESVYVFQEMKMGAMSAGCAVEQVSPEVGKKAVQECNRAASSF